MTFDSNPTIYHLKDYGKMGRTLRLNLKGINDLLDTPVAHFVEITESMKELLEERYAAYCRHGQPRFAPGREADPSRNREEIHPCLDNLPDKVALNKAKAEGGSL
tara:strand:+ start:1171 stop:1485 length:315 start_codon:yes stop_codon:yes gene_type:complete